MTDQNGSVRRMLDRPAELIDLDKTRDNPWWRRFRGGRHFSLVQDGNEVAAVSTLMRRDDSFSRGVRCRQTEVRFTGGGTWTVSTHAPGPRREKDVLGFRFKGAWGTSDRVVEVTKGVERIAYLASEPETNPTDVKTTDGRSVTLNHSKKDAASEALTITKVKGRYLLTPTSPVPLEAVLLHWHLMLGDYSVPQGGGGG